MCPPGLDLILSKRRKKEAESSEEKYKTTSLTDSSQSLKTVLTIPKVAREVLITASKSLTPALFVHDLVSLQ